MGPPMRKREGEKWTAPDVLKGWKTGREEERKREREKEGKRARKRQGLVVLGSGEENPRVLFGDADQESETRMSKKRLANCTETSCGESDIKTGLPYWLGTETINFIN
ncbi:hypothetical protein TNCV_2311681 [Trichonephila clavipes]|nr:hypothetical protein TNCV_2311681 [Trichonephila clavipes]